jgi:hypothetical protein
MIIRRCIDQVWCDGPARLIAADWGLEFPWDLARYEAVIRRFLPAISDEPFRTLVEQVFQSAHAMVQPVAPMFTSQGRLNVLIDCSRLIVALRLPPLH